MIEKQIGKNGPSAKPMMTRARSSIMKVAATPDSAEHSENTTTDTSRNGFRSPVRSDHAPITYAAIAHASDSPDPSRPIWAWLRARSLMMYEASGPMALRSKNTMPNVKPSSSSSPFSYVNSLLLLLDSMPPPDQELSLFFGVARLRATPANYAATAPPGRLPI